MEDVTTLDWILLSFVQMILTFSYIWILTKLKFNFSEELLLYSFKRKYLFFVLLSGFPFIGLIVILLCYAFILIALIMGGLELNNSKYPNRCKEFWNKELFNPVKN